LATTSPIPEAGRPARPAIGTVVAEPAGSGCAPAARVSNTRRNPTARKLPGVLGVPPV